MAKGFGITRRTASILIEAGEAGQAARCALQMAYSDACNLLVPRVVENRCWNRYNLHRLAYRRLRDETPLGAQMCGNTVTAASQLQGFVACKADAFGNATIFVDPAYTSQTCSGCGEIGLRAKHRFDRKCGRRAHSDVNAASNRARLGQSALSPRADVDRPYGAEIGH
jgi:hypothetical protein